MSLDKFKDHLKILKWTYEKYIHGRDRLTLLTTARFLLGGGGIFSEAIHM